MRVMVVISNIGHTHGFMNPPLRNPKQNKTNPNHSHPRRQSRSTSATQMNAESSRSHLIMMMVIRSTNRRSGETIRGKLTLVDLAGSERVDKSGAEGQRLKEAAVSEAAHHDCLCDGFSHLSGSEPTTAFLFLLLFGPRPSGPPFIHSFVRSFVRSFSPSTRA